MKSLVRVSDATFEADGDGGFLLCLWGPRGGCVGVFATDADTARQLAYEIDRYVDIDARRVRDEKNRAEESA